MNRCANCINCGNSTDTEPCYSCLQDNDRPSFKHYTQVLYPTKEEEMSKQFDPSKPCWTEQGDEVIIYTFNHLGEYSIIGCIKGHKDIAKWKSDGTWYNMYGPSSMNLTNKQPKKMHTVYVNLYANGDATLYYSKDDADIYSINRIRCDKIEWEK